MKCLFINSLERQARFFIIIMVVSSAREKIYISINYGNLPNFVSVQNGSRISLRLFRKVSTELCRPGGRQMPIIIYVSLPILNFIPAGLNTISCAKLTTSTGVKFMFKFSLAYITVPPLLWCVLAYEASCLKPGMLVAGRFSGVTPCSVKNRTCGEMLCNSRARLWVLYFSPQMLR